MIFSVLFLKLIIYHQGHHASRAQHGAVFVAQGGRRRSRVVPLRHLSCLLRVTAVFCRWMVWPWLHLAVLIFSGYLFEVSGKVYLLILILRFKWLGWGQAVGLRLLLWLIFFRRWEHVASRYYLLLLLARLTFRLFVAHFWLNQALFHAAIFKI